MKCILILLCVTFLSQHLKADLRPVGDVPAPKKESMVEIRLLPGEFLLITYEHIERWKGVSPRQLFGYPKKEGFDKVCRIKLGTVLNEKGELTIYTLLDFPNDKKMSQIFHTKPVPSFQDKINYDKDDVDNGKFQVSLFGEDGLLYEKMIKVDNIITKVKAYRVTSSKIKDEIKWSPLVIWDWNPIDVTNDD